MKYLFGLFVISAFFVFSGCTKHPGVSAKVDQSKTLCAAGFGCEVIVDSLGVHYGRGQ